MDQRSVPRRLCRRRARSGNPDRPDRSPADIPVLDSHQRSGPAGLRPVRRWAVERLAVPGDRRSRPRRHLYARPPHPVGQHRRPAPGPLSLLLHRLLRAGFQHLGAAGRPCRRSDGLARRLRGFGRSHGRGAGIGVVGHPQGRAGAGGASTGAAGLPPRAAQPGGHGLHPGLFRPLLRVVRPARVAGRLPGFRLRRRSGNSVRRQHSGRGDDAWHHHPSAWPAGQHPGKRGRHPVRPAPFPDRHHDGFGGAGLRGRVLRRTAFLAGRRHHRPLRHHGHRRQRVTDGRRRHQCRSRPAGRHHGGPLLPGLHGSLRGVRRLRRHPGSGGGGASLLAWGLAFAAQGAVVALGPVALMVLGDMGAAEQR